MKDQFYLIDNKDRGMPRTARSCSTVGLDSPRSAMMKEVGDSVANTTGDGLLCIGFFSQVAGDFILF